MGFRSSAFMGVVYLQWREKSFAFVFRAPEDGAVFSTAAALRLVAPTKRMEGGARDSSRSGRLTQSKAVSRLRM
jgi:hypothetical protein